MLIFSEQTKTYIYILCHCSTLTHMYIFYVIAPHWHNTRSWNPSSCETRTYLFYIVHLHHSCWCPDKARSQGISNHDIYYVEVHWFGPRTLIVYNTWVYFFCNVCTKKHPVCVLHCFSHMILAITWTQYLMAYELVKHNLWDFYLQ